MREQERKGDENRNRLRSNTEKKDTCRGVPNLWAEPAPYRSYLLPIGLAKATAACAGRTSSQLGCSTYVYTSAYS